MSYPVFASGDVLNASDMNAVGLWRVTGCTVTSVGGTAATASNGVITVGTGNTSVTVSNAFSSSFDNYKIIYTDGGASSTSNVSLQLGSTTTGYYGFLTYGIPTSVSPLGAGSNNTSSWNYAGDTTSNGITVDVELFNPFKTMRTQLSSRYMGTGTGAAFGSYQGLLSNSISYTAFTIAPGVGTITGGTIRVYGYNK